MGSWQVGARWLYVFVDVEDIYSAFGEVPPTQYHTDAAKDLANKYHLLHDEYKRIVETLVGQLLEAQENRGL